MSQKINVISRDDAEKAIQETINKYPHCTNAWGNAKLPTVLNLDNIKVWVEPGAYVLDLSDIMQKLNELESHKLSGGTNKALVCLQNKLKEFRQFYMP